MERNKGRGARTRRYLAALLAPAVIASVMQVTWPFFEHNPVTPYLLAVIFCAWYGGLGPGLLSIVVSFFLTDFFFIEPYFFFWFPKDGDLVRLLILAVVGVFICVMSELMHTAKRRAEINLESAKRAEESLREKERFVSQIAELTPVVLSVYDLVTERDTYISPDVVNMHGYTQDELAQMKDLISDLVHPEDVPIVREHFAQLKRAADGEAREIEYRIRHPNGEWRWLISRHTPFARDDQAEVRQVVTATLDITERKRAEEHLKQSERQLAEAQHLTRLGSWNRDLHSNVLNWSAQLYRIFGVDPHTFNPAYEAFVSEFVHPEDHALVRSEMDNCLKTREPFSFYNRILRPDGEERVVHVLGDIVSDKLGNPIRMFGTAQDVTERKRVEQKLREYEQAVEGSDEMVVVVDRDYRYVLANHAFLTHQGLERDQLIGRVIPDRLDSEVFKSVKQKLDECFEGNIVKYELRYNYPVLGERDVSISYFPIEGPTGIDRVACILKDVTESKRAEEQLKATSEQLRALSAGLQSAREEEASRISREIHDELGATLSSLRWDLEDVDEAISESGDGSRLPEMHKKIEAMMRLTDTTINTVRRIASELRPIALDALGLSEAIEWQGRQFQERTGIIVHLDCALENVDLDRERSTAVFRIFQEALTNILRHAQATTVNVQISAEEGEFILTISDNGRGITDDEKSGQHTLGLLGMRERAHLIRGKIDITGSNGKGTLITVRIPLAG